MRHVKLKNGGLFFDPETQLDLSGSKIAPLEEPVGSLTRQWIAGGGIVYVDSPATPEPETEEMSNGLDTGLSDEPERHETPIETLSVDDRRKVLSNLTIAELRRMASSMGVDIDRPDKKKDHYPENLGR